MQVRAQSYGLKGGREKGKPIARWGRKAPDLTEMAELPWLLMVAELLGASKLNHY